MRSFSNVTLPLSLDYTKILRILIPNKILEGNQDPLGIWEGGLKDENNDIEDENSFHDAGPIEYAAWGKLEDLLGCAVELRDYPEEYSQGKETGLVEDGHMHKRWAHKPHCRWGFLCSSIRGCWFYIRQSFNLTISSFSRRNVLFWWIKFQYLRASAHPTLWFHWS